LGLHSGLKTGVILAPLPANSGIIFGDISSGRQVKAVVDFVESTEYATKLQQGTVSFRTIEHLMATLNAYGITNALIKVGEEVPIMDGSAVQLCDLVESAGIVEQGETVEPVVIKEPILIGDKNKKFILAEPCDRLMVEYRLDYPQPVGKQTAFYDSSEGVDGFKSGVAPARTFGFVDQIKKFEGKGFAEGGKLSNFILIDDERVINTTLRFDNEFSRHKTLDFLGDIYLVGRPVLAKFTANMTGHTENILLTRRIVEEYVRQ
jgi:UDP-3-O-acyl N-acetylglucosamine deacetylase